MKTYKYHFPAHGQLGNEDDIKGYAEKVEDNLKYSPDCLGAWCMFPTDQKTLKKVTFDIDEKNIVTAVNIHTYTQLWEGREDDLKSCVAENLNTAAKEYFGEKTKNVGITLMDGTADEIISESSIQTYKYRFPATGLASDMPTFTENILEENLKNGPECLMAYCIFPSDSDILDKVTIDVENGKITAINLHTYTQLWEDMDDDFKACVQENLNEISAGITLSGSVEALGLEGDLPAKLYHITEKENINSIMQNGLIPKTGENNYKNMENYVYLCDRKDLAPWLSILKHMDHPVILEVDTAGLNGVEPGRMFKDRDYIPEGYGEYRTTESVPISSIKTIDFEKEYDDLSTELREKISNQLNLAASADEISEANAGLHRLLYMGIMEKTQVSDMDREKNHSWKDNGSDDFADFAEAVKQMTLSDMGVTI